MRLSSEEKAMLNGELGEGKKWALQHQLTLGNFFDADELVKVNQAHMMADPESIGVSGVKFLEELAANNTKVSIPLITDPRGVDLNYYRPLGQTEEMAEIERRFIIACEKMNILMTNTCVNYQTIMPPLLGEHTAFGDTGVVIYSNSVCGARSNYEGGPSALAAGITGRTPKYGLHLLENRQATKRYRVNFEPKGLLEWGLLGALIGKLAGSYWEVPVVEGIECIPTPDEIKHFGAAMASFGSTPLFHLVGITPECRSLLDVNGTNLREVAISRNDINGLHSKFKIEKTKIDVVVFAAPQLSLIEMQRVADLCNGNQIKIPMIVCTSPQVYADAFRMKLIEKIEYTGAKVLEGTCFYNQYAKEIGEANNWKNLLSNSAKIVNILGGYGYNPQLTTMENCVLTAISGKLVL